MSVHFNMLAEVLVTFVWKMKSVIVECDVHLKKEWMSHTVEQCSSLLCTCTQDLYHIWLPSPSVTSHFNTFRCCFQAKADPDERPIPEKDKNVVSVPTGHRQLHAVKYTDERKATDIWTQIFNGHSWHLVQQEKLISQFEMKKLISTPWILFQATSHVHLTTSTPIWWLCSSPRWPRRFHSVHLWCTYRCWRGCKIWTARIARIGKGVARCYPRSRFHHCPQPSIYRWNLEKQNIGWLWCIKDTKIKLISWSLPLIKPTGVVNCVWGVRTKGLISQYVQGNFHSPFKKVCSSFGPRDARIGICFFVNGFATTVFCLSLCCLVFDFHAHIKKQNWQEAVKIQNEWILYFTFEVIGGVVIGMLDVCHVCAGGFVALYSGVGSGLEAHETEIASEHEEGSVHNGHDEGFTGAESRRVNRCVQTAIGPSRYVATVVGFEGDLVGAVTNFFNTE